MLAKKYRTPVQNFPRKTKTVYSGDFFVVKRALNGLPYNRVGVVVPKKGIRGATERNRVKRAVFDEFGRAGRTTEVPGFDYLVIINSSDKLGDADWPGIKKELRDFLSKKNK